MPTLNWIGKDKIINHHREVPFRVLEHQYGFTQRGEQNTPTGAGNMLIHGDNLETLKALLPEYEGKIKCICIDPPYNTGEEGWMYNDNVNHPKIKEWLHTIVGTEGDDLNRHDKWLCMMYPRLVLLRKLLSADGLIFINIDDNEMHHLVLLMNEIFGISNKLSTLVWDLGSGTSAGHFTRSHEYIIVYAKDKSQVPNFSGGTGFIDDRAVKRIGKKNPASEFTFPKGTRFDAPDGFELTGVWGDGEKTTLVKGRMHSTNRQLSEDVTLSAGWTQKKQMKSWFSGKPTLDSKKQEVIEFYFRNNGRIYCVKKREKINPPSVIRKLASSKNGSKELKEVIGKNNFNFPKPTALIQYLIGLCTKEGDIVLDAFAGSGTTGHAALELGDRKFILIQMSETDGKGNEVDVCKQVTSERLKRAITGYEGEDGTGGSFDYYELGPPLFTEEGMLNELAGLENMRKYVFHSETQGSLIEQSSNDNEYFLGQYDDTAYYFLHSHTTAATLNHDFLSRVKTRAQQYIVYADNCILAPAYLTQKNIVFKKIPRDINKL